MAFLFSAHEKIDTLVIIWMFARSRLPRGFVVLTTDVKKVR